MLPNSNFNANVFSLIPPGVIKDNAAFVSNVFDLASEAFRGAQFVAILVQLGSIDADLATFKVAESSVKTDGTTLGGVPADIVDVTATVTPGATDDNKIYLVTVDLRADRKQFLQLQVTAGDGVAGTYLSAVAFPVVPSAIQPTNNAASHVAA